MPDTLEQSSETMIISEDDTIKKAAQEPAAPVVQNPVPASAIFADDPPPTYLSSIGANQHPRRSSQTPPPVPPKMSMPMGVKPTNHLLITRKHDSLKETICIDPMLVIPVALLPPFQPGQLERENLRVQGSHGSVALDIWVASDDENYHLHPRRTTLFLKTDHGSINAQLRTPGSPRPPIHFTVTSDNGSVQVRLPRSFLGLVFISTRHGSVKFSDAIQTQLTPLGDVKKERRYFIGDLSAWSDPNGNWEGDELVIRTSHGSIKVQYEDASEYSGSSTGSSRRASRQGFFSRVFGS